MTENHDAFKPKLAVPPLLCSSRLAISLTCCAAYFWAVFTNANLGMVIVCMKQSSYAAGNTSHSFGENSSDSTLGEHGTPTMFSTVDSQKNAMLLDKENQGHLFAATSYGCLLMQVLAGWLSDRYGKYKLELILGLTTMGLINFASPFLVEQEGVAYYFLARVILGFAWCFGVSPILPLLNCWVTPKESGLLICLAVCGVELASSATYPISACLCEYGGWKSIYYFVGVCCFLWTFVAYFLIFDNPSIHPRIDETERQYLLSFQDKGRLKTNRKVAVPWKSIWSSVPVWAFVATICVFYAAAFSTVIFLPLYFNDVLSFTIAENGIFASLPSIFALIIQLITGPLYDYVRAINERKQWGFSITTIRKTFHAIGTVVPAALLCTASQLDPAHKYVIVAIITVGHSFCEVALMGGFYFCLMDLAPDFVGVLQGIGSTAFAVQGLLLPMVVSVMAPNGSREEWTHVLLLFGVLYGAACLIYLLFGSSALQRWGKVRNVEEEPQAETLVP